jgi:hypothetical protein
MLDETAAQHALDELDAVREAVSEARFSEALLRIALLERDIGSRDPAVVDIWRRLLAAERARAEQRPDTSRPA